jgi:hypothetical protein
VAFWFAALANSWLSSALTIAERLAFTHIPLPGNLFSRSGYITLLGPKTKRTNSLFDSTLPVAMHFRSETLSFSKEEVIKQVTLQFPHY